MIRALFQCPVQRMWEESLALRPERPPLKPRGQSTIVIIPEVLQELPMLVEYVEMLRTEGFLSSLRWIRIPMQVR